MDHGYKYNTEKKKRNTLDYSNRMAQSSQNPLFGKKLFTDKVVWNNESINQSQKSTGRLVTKLAYEDVTLSSEKSSLGLKNQRSSKKPI